METINYVAQNAIAVIHYDVKRMLRKAKIDFDNNELVQNIADRVYEKISENPKAFQGHDIDSEAYLITEMFNKFSNES